MNDIREAHYANLGPDNAKNSPESHDMSFRPEISEGPCASRKLAEQRALKDPGIYLMALRAHLNQGKSAVSEMVESVADSLPQPRGFVADDGKEIY